MRVLHLTSTIAILLAALVLAYLIGANSVAFSSERTVIQAHEIEIVDANGTVRARLGTNLPDAVIDGQVVDRGGKAAGILLYDSEGQERSGYVTMDPGNNVMLTLDSKQRQVGLLAAGPEGGATVRLWRGDDAIEMRADGGGARMTAVRGGELVAQIPDTEMPEDACSAYRQALERMSPDAVTAACAERFKMNQCENCLARD